MPKEKARKNRISEAKTHVTGGIVAYATQKPLSVNTGISARDVRAPIELMSARRERKEQLEPCAKRPRYM
jgi:hypothetical protein